MNEALPGADNANNEAVLLENPRILQSLTALRSSLHSHRRYRLFKTFTSRLSVFFFFPKKFVTLMSLVLHTGMERST